MASLKSIRRQNLETVSSLRPLLLIIWQHKTLEEMSRSSTKFQITVCWLIWSIKKIYALKGLTVTEKWNTDNQMGTVIELKDQIRRGTKVTLDIGELVMVGFFMLIFIRLYTTHWETQCFIENWVGIRTL